MTKEQGRACEILIGLLVVLAASAAWWEGQNPFLWAIYTLVGCLVFLVILTVGA